MEQALADRDFHALGELAHWLKGSGGTVGFIQFFEPSQELELACKVGDAELSGQLIHTIRKIQSRMSTGAQSNLDLVESNLSSQEDEVPITNATITTTIDAEYVDKAIVSSLPMDNPRFRAVVERFIPRIEEQVFAMQDALDNDNFEELASLAHWLKGSGGNVGFNDFTETAAAMEQAAKIGNKMIVADSLTEIIHLTKCVRAGWDSLPAPKKIA
jgi:HPt (histidine-containing phosphotransfer) domain-containing protein